MATPPARPRNPKNAPPAALEAGAPGRRVAAPARAVASRVMGEHALLIHPRAEEIKLTNEVGTLVWQLVCERKHTAAEIAVSVAAAFEVDDETAAVDVAGFLQELERADLLEWSSPTPSPSPVNSGGG